MSDRIEMAGGRGEDQFTTDSFKEENSIQHIYSLEGYDKLTQFYTRMPSYDSFMAFPVTLSQKLCICKLGEGMTLQTVDLEKVVWIENLITASLAYQYATSCLLF